MLAVMKAKNITFKNLYTIIKCKYGDKKLYMLAKVKEKRAWDLHQVKCIKDLDNKFLVEVVLIRRSR